ncbi:hypothetical protein MACJ_001243 [Theileria orientalis]|uniref:Uncharacterized protein n=1 Tax=Theileria orientalis TaxID=68886 RepID=A0A976M9R3_THEOR|nr:hypothetical protein MACJ_001243 [Theileria orientalis]
MNKNGHEFSFKNHYDIVYYDKTDVSFSEDKEETRSTLNKLVASTEILSRQYIHNITSHRSMLDDLIKKNNDELEVFNLNEQFYSICSSMNIKNTKPIYGMLLTIVKDQIFRQFQFNELKNIIGALYYIHKVKRCSYKYTPASIISIMKNREMDEEMFEYYIETFSKVLKVDEISEEEVKYGVRKVFNRVIKYLTTNKSKIDFKIEDVYDLYDITDETDSNEIVEYSNYDKWNDKEYKDNGYNDVDNKECSKWYDDNKTNNENHDSDEHNNNGNDDSDEHNNNGNDDSDSDDYDEDNSDNNDHRCWSGYVSHKVKREVEGKSVEVISEEKAVSEELKRVLISKIESHYEDIIVTALKMFEIIKSNELNKEMMENGRMSGVKYRKLMIPTIIFIAASSYEVEMMGRYIAEGLHLEQGELIYSSKLMVEWLKNLLIKRYRYKIYNSNLFLQVVRSLKNNKRKVNEVYNDYKNGERGKMSEGDTSGNQVSKIGTKAIRLWEIISDNGTKVPKKLINGRIDILLNYIVQNLSEEMKRVSLKRDGVKIWFTKQEVIQYEEVMGDMSVLYRKKKYDEFRRQVRISQSYHQLIYKLVVLSRKSIEATSMELIKIADENEFMEMKSEVKLSNYAINKHMVNSVVLMAIRALRIPISSRMLFLYVKRPEGSFYIGMKKIMRVMAKIIEKRQRCRVTTMEEFLGRIVKEKGLEKMVIKTETLLRLVKDEKATNEKI